MMERWYVAATQPRAEAKALWHLQRQGFTAYLPQYRRLRRHARRTDEVRRPLFPGYLFVRMDVARAAWRAICSTVGVSRLVCNGDMPAAVPEDVIDDIRTREDANGLVVMTPAFRPGDAVRIVAGALADRIGLFQCASDGDRVLLLLEMLGRPVAVRVPMEAVAPVV
jgi:transcriptional antiterminator RfaH